LDGDLAEAVEVASAPLHAVRQDAALMTSYVEGQRLLRMWLDERPEGEPSATRFSHLLDETLVPDSIRAEPHAT
jgi:hypothetical protein